MKARRMAVALGGFVAIGLCGLAAMGEVPESYARLWTDPAIASRISEGIEKHRKGDARLRVVDEKGAPVTGATVRIKQQTHDFLFGCNLFVLGQLATDELNQKYERAFTNLFNFATLPFYWRDLEPEEGKPRFTEDSPRIWRRPPPDHLLKWCKANGITPKGHALMYAKNKFMPDWTAHEDARRFQEQAGKHMAGIAQRYGNDIPIWDAVNEEIPRRLHTREWHSVPEDYLAWCFQEAGRLFSKDVRLMINDGQIQAHYNTYDYKTMIDDLLKRQIRVGGIGMQFHVSRGSLLSGELYTPGRLLTAYTELGRLGLPLYVTEITVPSAGEDGPPQQAAIVENQYRLWFGTPQMAGVTWWNLGDGTAYENENKSLGGLLDADMNPKPAYRALERLINGEWKTSLSLKTGPDGAATFRGFLGRYDITAESGGRTVQGDLRLDKRRPAELILKLHGTANEKEAK